MLVPMSTEKNISTGLTYGSLGVFGPSKVPEIAASAESNGYNSFWTVEATGTDSISLLGAVSQCAPALRPGDRHHANSTSQSFLDCDDGNHTPIS